MGDHDIRDNRPVPRTFRSMFLWIFSTVLLFSGAIVGFTTQTFASGIAVGGLLTGGVVAAASAIAQNVIRKRVERTAGNLLGGDAADLVKRLLEK